jgi:hypothetical protein
MLTNIVDGWVLNPTIRYLPYRSTAMLLGQLEPLRRAHNYRDRIWVLPDDLTIAIPARGQFNREIRVPANSYLWAAQCHQFISEGEFLFIPIAPSDLSLQITDQATGVDIASEFISALMFWPPPGPPPRDNSTPVLLTQPRLFVAPGLLKVSIANAAATESLCQLLLYFLEPCDLSLEQSQCP